MQAIIAYFSLLGKLLPYHLLYGFQSAPWSILIQSENFNVRYYYMDKEIYVALDKSLFYGFLLKQKETKYYLKNTPKRLVLIYEKNEIYQRSAKESLRLQEFLSEISQLSYLKISLPVELDSAISVFEILKKVQSFVGIEVDKRIGSDTFLSIFKKYILGFPLDEYDYASKILKFRRPTNIFDVTLKTWVKVNRFVQCLTPAWPNLKYILLH